MRNRKLLSLAVLTLMMGGAQAQAEKIPADHAGITGPFATPMDVTKQCLECHEDASTQVMATSHWTWGHEQEVPGKGKLNRGKINAVNNFCISIKSNEPRCTSCHVGYGWKDDNFDFKDPSRVDCLACHDTTGTYDKGKDAPAGAGMPPGYTGNKKFDEKPYDLVKIAQNAGKVSRTNCLNCHANGGGGNNVKHGDIDLSLVKPDAQLDVHMAVEGNNFNCQECHVASEHKIKGEAKVVTPGVSSTERVSCTDCHEAAPHKKAVTKNVLNKHASKVACQTCHIPTFAKKDATKMSWDWSQAKSPKELPADQLTIKEHGHAVYLNNKGRFVYEQNVVPKYFWYDGTAGAYMAGDKIDPTKTTDFNFPNGSKDDPKSKLMPFKVHFSNQPYDKKQNIIAFPKVWGKKDDPDAYWEAYDWNKAIAAGMKANGLQYSGEYGFAPTNTYWPINHQVSPAKDALRCDDCHGVKGRLDWKALGYQGDPKTMPLQKK
jgi:octaheme c-type cytochrome (tetrathionate reductase family)